MPLATTRPGPGHLAGFPWAEPASTSDAPTDGLRNAAVRASRALAARRTGATLRNHAALLLHLGETDRALSELSEATELAPADAVVWSDLAVAHLHQAALTSDPYEVVLALSAADRAVHHDPTLPAARFNRALALAHLSLRNEAAAEWQLLLPMEHDSRWLSEAKRRAATLGTLPEAPDWEARRRSVEQALRQGDPQTVWKLVASSPQRFREHVEEALLPAWATAESEHRERDAKRFLVTARAIGEGLKRNGDAMPAATIAQIDQLQTAGLQSFHSLVAGFVDYGQGLALAQVGDFARALTRFRAAGKGLAAQGSPFAGWAEFQSALCLYQLAETRQAREILLALTRDPSRCPYRALQGRSLLLLGLMDVIEGNPTAALEAFESALAAFRRLNERPSMARLGALMASALGSLGQQAEAWRRLYPSLIEPQTLDQPKIRSVICEIASFMAREQGDTQIALSFQGELLRNAYAPFARIEALRGRVGLLAALSRRSEAAQDLAQARLLLQQIPGENRKSLEGDLLLAEAELAGTASPQTALVALDKAIPLFRETSYHFRLGQALFQRALSERAVGRTDAAERDLAGAIGEFEQQRERIGSLQERISFFDRSREMLDAMIALQLGRGHAEAALRYSEQAKARVLWDWMVAQPGGGSQMLAGPPETPEVAELLRALPPETTVLYYAVLPEQMVIWVLRRGHTPQDRTIAIGAKSLSDLNDTLRRSLSKGRSSQLFATSAKLYDALIAPVEPLLRPGDRLVLVPDRALHRLSFALLRSPRTRRYLIQDHILAVAPSLRVFEASLRRDSSFGDVPNPQALVVTDPAFDLALYPTLSRLPARSTEAAVAHVFPGSRLLHGEGATRSAFLRSAGDFEILHFGGHSVINPEFPLLSQMLFTPEHGDPSRGVLYSGDLLRYRLSRTRLAVLASCGTAQGRLSRTEGVENLARPFLAAGVPAVVASLWNVEDEATSDLFASFYKNLRTRFDAAASLRDAQIEAIEHGDEDLRQPRSWGAFEVIGAHFPTINR